MGREVRVLFGKEWKQAVHNRAALLTAILFPLLFLLIMPAAQLYSASRGMGSFQTGGMFVPPGLADVSPLGMFTMFSFPLFLVIGGLVVPSIAASYTIVTEREKRTVDLLLALPLSLKQIVAAKIAAVMALALAITLPLVLIDFALLRMMDAIDVALMAVYVLELVGALVFSASSAVAIALLARDYRAANNLAGAFMGPMILLTLGTNLLLPWGIYRLVFNGLLLVLLGVAILAVSLKVVTLERFAL